MSLLLAATDAASQPATQLSPESIGTTYHVAWEKWVTFHSWQVPVAAAATLLLILVLGLVLTRIFKKQLRYYQLQRATSWAIIAVAIYFGLLAAHSGRMLDNYDILTLIIHKSFAAILLVVAIRYLDRLIILPLLTRISKTTPSRFVHQIIMVVISIFALAGYCSWAFNIEIGSFLAGSAVISIVLGLALQETLGNFFSGMVLQASVPFQPGDWIQIGDIEGRVIEMTWRAVTLLTGGNNHVLIPNSSVSKEKIINFHSPSVATAVSISIGLDYNLPPNDAKRVLIQAAKDAPGVLPAPEPGVALARFEDSAILYTVGFWIDQPQKHGAIEEAVRTNVWYRLNQAGYNIPYPTRTLELADSGKKTAAAQEISRAARLNAISKSPLFSDLAPELQQKLAAETRDFFLTAGQTFYRQNDPGTSLFILHSGTVGITIHPEPSAAVAPASTPAVPPAPAGAALPGALLTPPDLDAGDMTAPAIFGEVSAMTSQPRDATVRAKTNVRALEIDQNHLQDLFSQDPNLMTHFSKVVTERQARREEMLQKLGAVHSANPDHSAPDSILDRMKRLFTRRIR